MAVDYMVKQEQLRFLRRTARRLREIGVVSPETVSNELLRLAAEIEREADDLGVIALRNGNGGGER